MTAKTATPAAPTRSGPVAAGLPRQLGIVLLIFLGIQLLNQFLLRSGGALERAIALSTAETRFLVGVYQQGVQALVAIFLARLLLGRGLRELGLNADQGGRSLRLCAVFALLWLAAMALFLAAEQRFFPAAWLALRAAPLPAPPERAAALLFQSLFPGLGEELLFRGFIIGLLTTRVFTGHTHSRGSRLGVMLLSAVFFAAAHIYFTVAPWRLIHIDGVQLALAFGCGLFYAFAFLRTGSLLAPILAHNFANMTSTLCGYALSIL